MKLRAWTLAQFGCPKSKVQNANDKGEPKELCSSLLSEASACEWRFSQALLLLCYLLISLSLIPTRTLTSPPRQPLHRYSFHSIQFHFLLLPFLLFLRKWNMVLLISYVLFCCCGFCGVNVGKKMTWLGFVCWLSYANFKLGLDEVVCCLLGFRPIWLI